MHELAITRSIIATCGARAGNARVLRVTLEVGTLTCVMPEALRFCYASVIEGTPLAGAELEIIRCPGRSRCRDCGGEVIRHDLLTCCPCGSFDLTPSEGGDELRIRSMDIQEAD